VPHQCKAFSPEAPSQLDSRAIQQTITSSIFGHPTQWEAASVDTAAADVRRKNKLEVGSDRRAHHIGHQSRFVGQFSPDGISPALVE
jgi:hypothetical protein